MIKNWTKEDINILCKMFSENKSNGEISKILSRTTSSIKNKAHVLGLKKDSNKWTNKEISLLKTLLHEGKTYREISNIINRTSNTCKTKAHSLGITFTNKYFWSDKDINTLEHYLYVGLSYVDIAKKLNRTPSAIEHKVNEYNLCYVYSKDGGLKIDLATQIYLIYFIDINLYKVGISNNYIDRIKSFGRNYEIITILEFDSGIDAIQKEKEWLTVLKPYMVNTGLLNNGNTETFRLTEE